MSTYERINRALNLIEDRLMETIDVHSLAREACMSDFHFQRTFHALAGQSCMRYIRRRRLSLAAEQLQKGGRILDIALNCQFESQEAFSRAFKAQFGQTPGAYRKSKTDLRLFQSRIIVTPEYIQHLFKGKTMQPTLKTIEAMTLVGLSAAFIPEKTNMIVIPRLWQMFQARCREIENRVPGQGIGLINCLPVLADSTEKAELVYMAATPVRSLNGLPAGLWATAVPSAYYAVFRTSVKDDHINKTIDYAYGEWLPKSGYARDIGPELEFYSPDFHATSNPEFDYAIPILK